MAYIPVHQARNKRCLCGDSLKTAKFYCLHEVDPFLKSDHIYGYSLPPCACARSKVFGSVVVVIVIIVNTKIAWSQHLGTWVTCKHNKYVKLAKTGFSIYRVARPTGVTNTAFQLAIVAMPIDRAHYHYDCMHYACLSAHAHDCMDVLVMVVGIILCPSCTILMQIQGVHGVCARRALV